MGNCINKTKQNEQQKKIEDLIKINNELDKVHNKKSINLKEVNPDSIPYFTFKDKVFTALCSSVYDGDTFTAIFEYNNEIIKYKCRCYGYDSPEMKPLLSKENRDEEIKLAHKAKERFLELVNKSINGLIRIECLDFDKYGRILVKVYNGVDDKSINNIMIDEGHGKSYFGGTKS